MSSDAAGLFAAPSSPTATQAGSVAPQGRREKLYWYDSVASQMLNPYGESAFTEQSTEVVWRAAAQGSKRVAFHTELAAADPWRQGVGISRSAEALLAAIRTLETDNVKKLLKEEHLTAALEEAAGLKPMLERLNQGKGSQGEAKQPTMSQLKKRRVEPESDRAPVSKADMEAAAQAVHKWFQKERSPLRAILAILAGNGTFFAGHVADKTCRAAIQHKPLNEAAWAAAAVARSSSQKPTIERATASDTSGLFDTEG